MWRLQGGYTIMAKDRYGCATRRSKSTCDNSHTIQRQRLERRVLSGLKDRMLAPDLVAEFMRAFAEETAALQRESAGASARLSRELADVERRLTGVLTAIENGAWSDSLQARLTELEHRKAALTRDIAEAAASYPGRHVAPKRRRVVSPQGGRAGNGAGATGHRVRGRGGLGGIDSTRLCSPQIRQRRTGLR